MPPLRPRSSLWINGNALFWIAIIWTTVSGVSGLCLGMAGRKWADAAMAVAMGAVVAAIGVLMMRAGSRREREARPDD